MPRYSLWRELEAQAVPSVLLAPSAESRHGRYFRRRHRSWRESENGESDLMHTSNNTSLCGLWNGKLFWIGILDWEMHGKLFFRFFFFVWLVENGNYCIDIIFTLLNFSQSISSTISLFFHGYRQFQRQSVFQRKFLFLDNNLPRL